MAAGIGAGIGGAIGLVLAVITSQWWPMLGGTFNAMADPFSKLRIHYLPHHCILFGLLGVALGAVAGAWIKYIKT